MEKMCTWHDLSFQSGKQRHHVPCPTPSVADSIHHEFTTNERPYHTLATTVAAYAPDRSKCMRPTDLTSGKRFSQRTTYRCTTRSWARTKENAAAAFRTFVSPRMARHARVVTHGRPRETAHSSCIGTGAKHQHQRLHMDVHWSIDVDGGSELQCSAMVRHVRCRGGFAGETHARVAVIAAAAAAQQGSHACSSMHAARTYLRSFR